MTDYFLVFSGTNKRVLTQDKNALIVDEAHLEDELEGYRSFLRGDIVPMTIQEYYERWDGQKVKVKKDAVRRISGSQAREEEHVAEEERF